MMKAVPVAQGSTPASKADDVPGAAQVSVPGRARPVPNRKDKIRLAEHLQHPLALVDGTALGQGGGAVELEIGLGVEVVSSAKIQLF